ncbi:hypothetical protein F350042L8_09780 [Fusobacterium ulcerans]|uniref:glycosyltransferase n=1 Tax=Fusobacterium ulcerans TaxID=861 RepID=UPI0034B69C9A
MKKEKLVSIIIAVYNGMKYISETLECCYKQTYKNLEVIIIDDFSEDQSVKIIENYIKDKINFKLIKNDKNLGIIQTINKGIDLSKGFFIINLGQDDLLYNNHVEIMIKNFTEDASLLFCDSNLINSKGEIFYEHNRKKKFFRNLKSVAYNLSLKNFINSCGLMYSKEKALRVGKFQYFKKYPHYGEWLFWLKLLSVGQFFFVEETKSLYRRHEANITNTFKDYKTKKNLQQYFLKCRKYAFENYFYEFNFKQKTIFLIIILKNKLKIFFGGRWWN